MRNLTPVSPQGSLYWGPVTVLPSSPAVGDTCFWNTTGQVRGMLQYTPNGWVYLSPTSFSYTYAGAQQLSTSPRANFSDFIIPIAVRVLTEVTARVAPGTGVPIARAWYTLVGGAGTITQCVDDAVVRDDSTAGTHGYVDLPAGRYTPTLGGDGFGGTMYYSGGKMTITMIPAFV